jgi:hypothetical protein
MLLATSSCESPVIDFAYNNDAAVSILNELTICQFLNTSAGNATTSLKPS